MNKDINLNKDQSVFENVEKLKKITTSMLNFLEQSVQDILVDDVESLSEKTKERFLNTMLRRDNNIISSTKQLSNVLKIIDSFEQQLNKDEDDVVQEDNSEIEELDKTDWEIIYRHSKKKAGFDENYSNYKGKSDFCENNALVDK